MTTKESKLTFHLEIITQMLTLSTASLGLVAALAWNTVVQSFINDFIKPFIPAGSSAIISQLIYALVITAIVVIVTLKLTNIKNRLESILSKP